jgi:Uma2 family endonuclease
MVTIPSEYRLPTAEDLPHSDETPVDNELQNNIPNILLSTLMGIWGDRTDWFLGVDMCFYYELNKEEPLKSKAIVPDGFLVLGAKPRPDEYGRLSYLMWQEDNIMPILVLEVVSNKYNGEYDLKLLQYQGIGILYYVIYNAASGRRGRYKGHPSLEVYKLIEGKYELLPSVSLLPQGQMVWMPEVGLGIGCEKTTRGNWRREWMYWYDRSGLRYVPPEEGFEQERQQKEKLAAYLRTLGIDPDRI